MAMAEEAVLEQGLAMIAGDDQHGVLPHAHRFQLRNQPAQRGVGVRDRVPVGPLQRLAIVFGDLAAFQRGVGEAVRDGVVVIGEVRRLEIEIDELRRLPRCGIAERGVEAIEHDVLVDQQRALRGETEGALVLEHFGIDEAVGNLAHSDSCGNSAEILRLSREHADLVTAGIELAEQARRSGRHDEAAREERFERGGGETHMAVGGREGAALRRHAREIGGDGFPVDALAQHIRAGAFENDDDEMRLRAADWRGGQGLGNRDQRKITAVAILVDPIAGNVERERMAAGIERGRVDGPPGKAVTIAVEIARQCQPVGQPLPGDDPLQPARRIAVETRQHDHRAGEGQPHEGDCLPARPGGRQRRLSAEPFAQQVCCQPPCREEEQQRAHTEHDLVLGEQQRIGRAATAQLL
tara:strand:+ start:2140 stop:3369 length:1230 start_codon:yes stop_codon:yes gene_type:complete